MRPVGNDMGVKIALAIGVLYVLTAVAVSFCFWGNLHVENHPPSATMRNLVLIWGAPLAMGLAVWRSIVAQQQAEIAQRGLLADRYQRAVEMLGHAFLAVRIGGIHALRNLALEHPEYNREVETLLNIYCMGKNRGFTVRSNKDENQAYPADEWEAREAASAVYQARKSIAREANSPLVGE